MEKLVLGQGVTSAPNDLGTESLVILPGISVFTKWLSVLCMRSKAWLATPVLLAHAEVTETIVFFQWVQTLGTPQYGVFANTAPPTGWVEHHDAWAGHIHIVRGRVNGRVSGFHSAIRRH